MLLKRTQPKRKGQAMVEYAILLCGIALISIVAVSLIGHKTADLLGTVAVILPGAHADDNGPINAGHLIETTNTGGRITLDTTKVLDQTDRLGRNLGTQVGDVLVFDP